MISTVLLCPPKHYQIEYEINPWMHTENKVQKAKVQEEFEGLVGIYKKLGLEVLIIDPQLGLPDMVYAANHGFVIDDIFIRSNFRYPQRRKEAYYAEKFFLERKYKVEKVPHGTFFEGQGDMFYRDGKFFCGYGKRTAKEAIAYLEKIVGEKIISFEVNDPYFYHLDMSFGPLGNGKVVINPASFSRKDFQKIKNNFKKVFEADKFDNQMMCCNLVAVGDTVVLGKGISKGLRRQLEKEGYKVIETPMTEFFKGGGSVKCLTLEFFRS